MNTQAIRGILGVIGGLLVLFALRQILGAVLGAISLGVFDDHLIGYLVPSGLILALDIWLVVRPINPKPKIARP